ncbi:MAG: cytochrome c-type biogenesis protein CcmH [Candidatus Latescibacteria bacterium]|jgi:cytochrome c-type biogenesis protein CcmH|nr:cytochrome c-type biogenesis protein CcmH [Candidatus Latescibacterota bacterium]
MIKICRHLAVDLWLLASVAAAQPLQQSEAAPTIVESMSAKMPSAMQIRAVTTQIICLCGCNLMFADCPHNVCSFRDQQKPRIAKMLSQGLKPDVIIAKYVAEYGERILASPNTEGFNLVAWIVPFLGAAIGAFGLGVMVKKWTKRQPVPGALGSTPLAGGSGSALDDDQLQRIDAELASFD